MEKTNNRVYKRHLMIAILILLATLNASCDKKIEAVKLESNEINIVGNYQAFDGYKPIAINMSGENEIGIPAKVKVQKLSPKKVEWIDYVMTHYVSDCEGCSGFTYSEYDVRNTIWYGKYRILAVDPKYIDEGSIVEIIDGDKTIEAIALDRGGMIKGRRLDLLVEDVKYAFQEGKKEVKLRVVRDGWQEDVESQKKPPIQEPQEPF